MRRLITIPLFFFFNDTATTEIYTLSLHDALPICIPHSRSCPNGFVGEERCTPAWRRVRARGRCRGSTRSEEHTSELQSHLNLVCRLLLEKKKKHSAIVIYVDNKIKRKTSFTNTTC